MAKIKRGGTNPINEVAELNNFDQMRFWMRRGTRSKRKSPFVFKQRCKHMGDTPLLIIGPAGKKIKGSLVRAVRIGSKTIKGWLYRENKNLIIETKDLESEADQNKARRYLYAVLGKYNVRIPLKSIVFRNPTENRVEAKTPKDRWKRAMEDVKDSPFDEILNEEDIESLDGADSALEDEKIEHEVEELLESEAKDLEDDWWNEETDSDVDWEHVIVEKQRRYAETKEQASILDASLQHKKQRIQQASENLKRRRAESNRIASMDRSLRQAVLTAQSYDEAFSTVQKSHLAPETLSSFRRVKSDDFITSVLRTLKARKYERKQHIKNIQEKIATRDRSLDQKVHNQFVRNISLVEQEAEIHAAQKNIHIAQGFAKIDSLSELSSLSTLAPIQTFQAALQKNTLRNIWSDIQEDLNRLYQQEADVRLEVSDADEIDLMEARAKNQEEEADDIIFELQELESDWGIEIKRLDKLSDKAEEELEQYEHHPEFKTAEKELIRLQTIFKSKKDELDVIKAALLDAHYQQRQSEKSGDFLNSLDILTQTLISDRRRQSPSAPMHHTDPMDDLRFINPRIHSKLEEIVEKVPALRLMICYMIYRIQDIEQAIVEFEETGATFRIADTTDRDGPLADLWNAIPNTCDPKAFISQYKQWESIENRYWYILKNPLETKIR
ncbi:MAG: hypothetical protein VX278_15630 [Myxococcota bacterium]|nr:hypothetical protein [Myxococcota bacterium]